RERRAVVRELSSKYRRASKKDKGKILEQLVALTGYNRSYAARALRQVGRPRGTIGPPARRGGGRRRMYDDIVPTLTKVWAILDCPSGKRLAPFLPEVLPRLELFGEIQLTADQRQKLMSISLKGRSGTKPGAFLKHEVPIKTFADWNDTQPGFLEVDLVSHDGSSARGDFAQTLDAVDVATGWTETVAVKNKAQKWVFAALQQIIAAMPFPVKGIDSDNGAEFINNQLIRFCAQNQITFTRSR
ncbi:MAG: transposase family protein, partial [Clostridia bacterium]|nr:transposase family protein [Clostridia bacterium]